MMDSIYFYLLFIALLFQVTKARNPYDYYPRGFAPCASTSYCPPFEVYEYCGSSCIEERSCSNPYPKPKDFCTEQCITRCVCDWEHNYVRGENGQCVPLYKCPSSPTPWGAKCRPNEVFNSCASACDNEPTCLFPHPVPSEVCTQQCVPRCECDTKKGFIRDETTGLCIPKSQCTVCESGDGCGPNSHSGCKPCCPESVLSCQNQTPKPCNKICTFICEPTCVCDYGFLLDEVSGTCVEVCPHLHKH